MLGEQIPYKMLSQDVFSTWMGIEIIECEIGRRKVGMTIRKEMRNSMGKAHRAIAYTWQIQLLVLQLYPWQICGFNRNQY